MKFTQDVDNAPIICPIIPNDQTFQSRFGFSCSLRYVIGPEISIMIMIKFIEWIIYIVVFLIIS